MKRGRPPSVDLKHNQSLLAIRIRQRGTLAPGPLLVVDSSRKTNNTQDQDRSDYDSSLNHDSSRRSKPYLSEANAVAPASDPRHTAPCDW